MRGTVRQRNCVFDVGGTAAPSAPDDQFRRKVLRTTSGCHLPQRGKDNRVDSPSPPVSVSSQCAPGSSAAAIANNDGAGIYGGRKAYTVREFREIYGGMSNTHFYEIVKRGELQVHKIGRKTVVAVAEAERWFQGCAKGAR